MAAKRALLRPFAEIHSDVIVKLTDADVVPSDKVLDIEVENANQIVCVLPVRHIKLALLTAFERTQTGNELQIPKAAVAEILISFFASVGAVTGEHGENIELNGVLFQKPGSLEHLEVGAFSVFVNAKTVALAVAVKAQANEELVLPQKRAPLIGEERSVGLNGIKNPGIFAVVLLNKANEGAKVIKPRKKRFAALKGKGNAFSVRELKRAFDEPFGSFRFHQAEIQNVPCFCNIAIKAIFAP